MENLKIQKMLATRDAVRDVAPEAWPWSVACAASMATVVGVHLPG